MRAVLAGGVILDSRNRMLLWRRNEPGKNQWELPGKLVDSDESLEDAVSEGIENKLGVDEVWVGDIVYSTKFQQGSVQVTAELMAAKIIDADELEPTSPNVDRVGYFALHTLEDLQKEGRLSPSVENLVRMITRNDLTLADFTP